MTRTISLLLLAACTSPGCLHSAELLDPIQEITLDDHAVQTVPVSGQRVTTISFPGPIQAIDGALVATDPQSPALFQLSHTKGTSYFSVRALVRDAVTNLNVRWDDKTYALELHESAKPWYLANLKSKAASKPIAARPVTPPRLIGLLDKAKAFAVLKAHYPEAVSDVEFRSEKPCITECSDYRVEATEIYRFNAEDTLVLHLTIVNKTDKVIEFVPEQIQVKAGQQIFYPSLTQLPGLLTPNEKISGYVAITGTSDGERNELSIKNDFTILLARVAPSEPVPAVMPAKTKSRSRK
ncbi:MAG: hypothetical protein JWL59_4857 [Chthoniobacteraceae bacterium]|nr:hypothetical protein [Chthoniobacteraceae bacterium]